MHTLAEFLDIRVLDQLQSRASARLDPSEFQYSILQLPSSSIHVNHNTETLRNVDNAMAEECPTITIRPACRADIPYIVDISMPAFDKDEMVRIINPRREEFPGCVRRGVLLMHRANIIRPGMVLIVAETSSSTQPAKKEIIGFAGWAPSGPNPITAKWRALNVSWKNWFERNLLAAESKYASYFDSYHKDPASLAIAMRNIAQGRIMSVNANFLQLRYLVTAVQWQGQGVGKKLVEWGQQIAREQWTPIAVRSSPVGRGFYERMGFKVIGWVSIDEAGTVRVPELLWEPEKCEGRWLEQDALGGWSFKEPPAVPVPSDFAVLHGDRNTAIGMAV